MADLTEDQISFLRDQRIPLGLLFDASGMRRSEYQVAMRTEDKLFAYGVTACTNGGHTLRSLAGECIQCKTASIAFTLRYYGQAWIYIAGSLRAKLLKVGSSKAPENRINDLNRIGYGNSNDWNILAQVNCKQAGAVEFATHKRLMSHFRPVQYIKQGAPQNSYELFSCGYDEARAALMSSLSDEDMPAVKEFALCRFYEFKQA